MKKTILIAAVALSTCLGAAAMAVSVKNYNDLKKAAEATRVDQTPVDLTYAAEKAVNSVVYIKVTATGRTRTVTTYDPFEEFFGEFFGRGGNGGRQQRQYREPDRKGAGSGVILSADGYIVTNNHVVEGADELSVKLNDNREFKARIIGMDKNSDLALIKIEADKLQPITVGSSDNLRLGEWVLAIGNPFSLTSTVTAGIVSAKARNMGMGGVESFIQTDAAINPGNSGGALVNTRGELVGINAMIYSQTGSYAGYGFAIPVSIMNKVVSDLKEYGTVQRAMLGVSGTDVANYIDMQHEKGNKDVDLGTTEGFYVGEVSLEGAAAEAGLKEGDVITHIDGKKVTKYGEMMEILTPHRPGDRVEVTFLRDKKEKKVTVTLRNEQGTTSVVQKVSDEELGIGLRALTDSERKQLALRNGLVVTAVRDGKMKQAGVTKGIIILQVNDRLMSTPEDFDAAVKEANLSTERVLWIRAMTQSGLRKSYTVELSDPAAK